MAVAAEELRVVILGGGLHGASTAFYLKQLCDTSNRRLRCTIVEATKIAAAASGKGGGFLAGASWASSPATRDLHASGFKLHAELAQQFNLTSYHRVRTLQVHEGSRSPVAREVGWLDGRAAATVMDNDTAQVNPEELCQAFTERSRASVIIDRCVGVVKGADSKVSGVQLASGACIDCDVCLVALGPWAGVFIEDNFAMRLPMVGVKSSSIILDVHLQENARDIACFCAEDQNDCHLELYARNSGKLFIAGLGGSVEHAGDDLRVGGRAASADDVEPEESRVSAALKSIASLSRSIKQQVSISSTAERPENEVCRSQACMRPLLPDGLPAMGAIEGTCNSVFVSAGHNCWGILWSPACGLAMASLILTGQTDVTDMRPFKASRFKV